MKDIMKEDDPTGLRRMFPDVPWDSPEMDALGEDINHFIDFIQESRELRRAEGLTQSDMARRLKTRRNSKPISSRPISRSSWTGLPLRAASMNAFGCLKRA